jgi:Na+/H+ antiporter NhaD/arsenite permease-like protein
VAAHLTVRGPHRSPPADFPHKPLQQLIQTVQRGIASIALFPLFAPKFWHHHFPKVSAFWALVLAIPFLIFHKDIALYQIAHIYIIDYIPFIILLWSLFVVSGGIYIKGSLKGTPAVNVTLLLIGTLLASLIGTTGASMLLIRPVLRQTHGEDIKSIPSSFLSSSSATSAGCSHRSATRRFSSDFYTASPSFGH